MWQPFPCQLLCLCFYKVKLKLGKIVFDLRYFEISVFEISRVSCTSDWLLYLYSLFFMWSFMSSQPPFLRKLFPTHFTAVLFVISMRATVSVKCWHIAITFPAEITVVRFLSSMLSLVNDQNRMSCTDFSTEPTGIQLYFCVTFHSIWKKKETLVSQTLFQTVTFQVWTKFSCLSENQTIP